MTVEPEQSEQEPTPKAPAPRAASAAPAPRWAWALAAAACAAVIALLGVAGARSLAGSERSHARQQFRSGATAAAASLSQSLERQESLGVAASALFAGNAHTSPQELLAWARSTHLFSRNPELSRLALLGYSPPSASAGPRCGVLAGVGRGITAYPPKPPAPCAISGTLRGAAASGRAVWTSVPRDGSLGVIVPVYRGGTIPRASARAGALVGWLRGLLSPTIAAATAAGAPGVDAVAISHATGQSTTTFSAGTVVRDPQTTTVSLRGGWSARILGPALPGGMLAGGAPANLLIAALLIAAIVGVLVFLLAGREQPPATPGREPREDLYDPVTSLPNQGLMADRMERVLARVGRAPGMLAGALVVDLDSFEEVNETHGREAGDELLAVVAGRLQGVVRDEDSVGRMGGDEFLVVVEATARSARLDRLATRIIEALRKPVELRSAGTTVSTTASVGLAFGRYADPEQLLHDARLALYASKGAGKDRYTVFNANLRSVIEGRSVVETELDRAVAEKQFSLIYQPVYDLGARKVVALEALIRWQHPTRGELLPADFIPVAEESGLIVPIGRWVLEEACTRAAAWNVAGHRVGVSVTVSPHQLGREGFATDVLRALQQSGLSADQLTLEVAEATLMEDVAAAAQRLLAIRQLGVKIAIDDFGRGYAYRSDLQRLPLDYLKVDRSSLAASEDEDYRSWLLEAILVFGRDLGLTVIAKGVDSSEQLASLQSLGCTLAQGAFLGEPARAQAVERLFDAQPVTG